MKKTYITPATILVRLHGKASLLQASIQVYTTTETDKNDKQYSRSSSFWDDEEDY